MHHIAFVSEAGSGKTALVSCIANEMGYKAYQTVGSVLLNMDKVNDICEKIDGGIMFIDEAHDLQKTVIPGFLKLLEDFIMYTSYGSFVVKPFCCIMATNKIGELDEALRSRLGIPIEFAAYTESEMAAIAQLRAKELEAGLKEESAQLISQRSRGNPRYCGHLVRESHIEMKLAGEYVILPVHCHDAFELLGVTASGLNIKDIKLLTRLKEGPMSVSLCQTYMSMDPKTFQALHETFLLREGYISISSRGRNITPKGVDAIQRSLMI
jgi:Holliday junction DNA helicase RuvB